MPGVVFAYMHDFALSIIEGHPPLIGPVTQANQGFLQFVAVLLPLDDFRSQCVMCELLDQYIKRSVQIVTEQIRPVNDVLSCFCL
jgi:hypothetical protein